MARTRIAIAVLGTCLLGMPVAWGIAQETPMPPPAGEAAGVRVEPSSDSSSGVQSPNSSPPGSGVRGLLDLDLEQLSRVPIRAGANETNLTAPSTNVQTGSIEGGSATTTAEALTEAPSVTTRRISAINLDPRVRGYHSSQLNATANGIPQLKTRVDIDSVFSQIDPGIVDRVTVVDGPYTPFFGPGFAFLTAELIPPPSGNGRPETRLATEFVYGTNGRSIYHRDGVYSAGRGWGALVSYGLRSANDYDPGGHAPPVPSSYQKWDGLFAFRFDLDSASRLEFNYLRTEMNDVELPGIIYDINNSKNDQFNLRYVIQEDPAGPEQLVLQTWWNQTYYHGDSLRPSKQETFYEQFYTLPQFFEYPVATFGQGNLRTTGVRALRTLGEVDDVQWTFGADWRRYRQRYQETDVDPEGRILYGGNVYGIPDSQMDDLGALANVRLPLSDELSIDVGGRVDYCRASIDANDPI
ncbi:MAG: TonB-dependent receptor plug domain-containing protein, partial [Thermoguttaceae bacterium]|nr:TonB-dependent receptor plug domain-containing protein [Thermoguttaceae bacterium]